MFNGRYTHNDLYQLDTDATSIPCRPRPTPVPRTATNARWRRGSTGACRFRAHGHRLGLELTNHAEDQILAFGVGNRFDFALGWNRAAQNLLAQRVFDELLDRAAQRARAHVEVGALLHQEVQTHFA